MRLISGSAPDVVVLDVHMPGMDGLEFCRSLKTDPATDGIAVVMLSGSEGGTATAAEEAGADAAVRKPFSPLQLLAVVEQLAGSRYGVPFRSARADDPQEQLLLYARDLRHVLEIEKGQRSLVQSAYRETVMALASALESKDTGTRQHSQRVQRYAIELARAVDPELLEDPSTEYGFLLHDVGKIGIPDRILQKPEPLTTAETRLMKTHTVLGEQVLSGVAFFHGEGLRIVRSHHERWDGDGYPDGLAGTDIPLGGARLRRRRRAGRDHERPAVPSGTALGRCGPRARPAVGQAVRSRRRRRVRRQRGSTSRDPRRVRVRRGR